MIGADTHPGYVGELVSWCRKQLLDAQKRPEILALADHVRAHNLVLPANKLELFARYQTTLDNQLYKALRALREMQVWRRNLSSGHDEEASEHSDSPA